MSPTSVSMRTSCVRGAPGASQGKLGQQDVQPAGRVDLSSSCEASWKGCAGGVPRVARDVVRLMTRTPQAGTVGMT